MNKNNIIPVKKNKKNIKINQICNKSSLSFKCVADDTTKKKVFVINILSKYIYIIGQIIRTRKVLNYSLHSIIIVM